MRSRALPKRDGCRFEGAPANSYLVGPREWARAAELRSVSPDAFGGASKPRSVRVAVQPGETVRVPWVSCWAAGRELAGQVTWRGAVRPDLRLVPQEAVSQAPASASRARCAPAAWPSSADRCGYAIVVAPCRSAAIARSARRDLVKPLILRVRQRRRAGTPARAPGFPFGRSTRYVPLERNGAYRIAPDDPLPWLLAVCVADERAWGSSQGLQVVESIRPGELVELAFATPNLR